MDKIPTAEKYFEKHCYSILPQEGLSEVVVDKYYFKQSMIEFAQLHVIAALNRASEFAKLSGKWGREDFVNKGITTRDEDGDWIDVEIDKDSILTSYPLENIK